jgi:hypothetical protein
MKGKELIKLIQENPEADIIFWDGKDNYNIDNAELDVINGTEIILNQDNTVNITSVEEKLYSREEVITLIKKYRSDDFVYGKEHKIFKNWIKENL